MPCQSALLPTVFFLTDPVRTPRPWRTIAALPRGWGVIYRHFGEDDRYRTGASCVAAARRAGVVILIAADIALARALGADGVHWPGRLLPAYVQRLHPAWRITASAHDRSAITAAARAGVDAVLVSPVFCATSGRAEPPLGLHVFRRLARYAPVPCFALGGIGAAGAGRVAASAGIAGIGAIESAFTPAESSPQR